MPTNPDLSKRLAARRRDGCRAQTGTPGVWFYSLSCNQPLAVAAARLSTGLPYVNAEMEADIGEVVDYTFRRQGSGAVAHYRYRGQGVPREAATASIEFFLLERYYFHAIRSGSLLRAQVAHDPYRYSEARLEAWSPVPAQLDGFDEIHAIPRHVCHVEALDVKIYGTQKLAKAYAS